MKRNSHGFADVRTREICANLMLKDKWTNGLMNELWWNMGMDIYRNYSDFTLWYSPPLREMSFPTFTKWKCNIWKNSFIIIYDKSSCKSYGMKNLNNAQRYFKVQTRYKFIFTADNNITLFRLISSPNPFLRKRNIKCRPQLHYSKRYLIKH